ncbi:helix-turn-helix domain-containing protein [Streptomyces rubiginosohelvolus]|uniref:helix-turn-helix domain-containing protein n=1 Tax=Streptomyces rubiginosohelvolus TaxID=67362 RepID=UPI0036D76E89
MTQIRCWSGAPEPMGRTHTHDGIEINVVRGGDLAYLMGGRYVVVPAGSVAVIWSAVAHRLVRADPECTVRWVTVPLSELHHWRGHAAVMRRLLRDTVVTVRQDTVDTMLTSRWESPDAGPEDAVRLEVQAAVQRWLWSAGPADGDTAQAPAGGPAHAAAVAEYVAHHLREPLPVQELAQAVGLAPGYAMTVFKAVTGVTIGAYIRQCRTSLAHDLLLTTDLSVVQVAHTAGFGSASRFYATFSATYGVAPAAFRRRHRSLYPTE